MPKFIIIDHSLCDLQGHHYECSVAIAEAAARLGYKPLIVANRRFPVSLYPKEIETISVFERDWFDQPTITPDLPLWQESLQALGDFFGDRPLEELNQKFLALKNYYFLAWRTTKPQWALLLEKIEGSTERLINWIKKDINLLQSIPLSNTIWGFSKIIWGLIRFSFNLLIKIINRSLQKLVKIKEPQQFSETLAQVLITLSLTSEDHILVHTLSIEQLEKIFNLLKVSDSSRLPQYHILLRRNIDDPLVINAQGIGLKNCLNLFHTNKLWPEKIKFYTDTEDLVSQHNTLSPIQFIQIPIPFRQEKLQDSLLVDNSNNSPKPFHVVYLGDARSEKGYQYLPDLVHTLWNNYIETGKIKFTIQSNFNIQGGESEILKAKLKLEQYPSSKIKLVQEAMFPDEYYQLLSAADLVILPYDPQQYQRTSGVLTEALAAGKPVVVPANSWLAKQVDESRARIYQSPTDLAQSVIEAIENLDELTQSANEYKKQWREQQSPDNFVRILLEKTDFSAINRSISTDKNLVQSNFDIFPEKINPSTLIILDIEAFFNQDTLDINAFSQIQYLFQCGYQVYGLFYLNPQQKDQQTIDLLIYQVKNHIEKFPFEQKWFLNSISEISVPTNINSQQYIDDVYHHRSSLIQGLVEVNSLALTDQLIQFLRVTEINAILINSILSTSLIQKLGLVQIPKIYDVSLIKSFDYALSNQRDLDSVELSLETDLLNQCQVIVTGKKIIAGKLTELLNLPTIYYYTSNQDYSTLNQAFTTVLGDRALLGQGATQSKKIAVLFPWQDILERKSGASQRVGLLIDYLQEESCEIGCFSIGQKRQVWQAGIYYDYFEPRFSQATLVEQVYKNAYQSWHSTVSLLSEEIKEHVNLEANLESENPENDWLPWIYYQFRFDQDFHQWIEEITDWADVVILEYPFWAEIVGKICHQKKIPLILTAHDILSKKLDENSLLGKIALAEEINALKQADSVVTLSENDQAFFQKYNIQSSCVPIGIDTQKINSFCQHELLLKTPKDLEIIDQLSSDFYLFVGSKHLPNIEAVKQIRQWLHSPNQSANTFTGKFVIVGGCWEMEAYGNFLSLGKVSDELLSYLYQHATLVVSPLRLGTGMSVKTIEAMAYGKVILGTSISFRGYPVESGVNCLICNTLESYPEIITDLLKNPQNLIQIGHNAKLFAQNYDYHYLYKNYLNLIL